MYLSDFTFAQNLYFESDNSFNSFIERNRLRGNIKLNDEVRPFLTKKIFDNKFQLKINNTNEISSLEYYNNKYIQSETDNISFSTRQFVFYKDSLFNFSFKPLGGYKIKINGEFQGHEKWVGARFEGSYDNWFSGYFEYHDKGEFGDNRDTKKEFVPVTGAYNRSVKGGFEYSDLRGGINFDFGWGQVSLMKDYLNWGHGEFGNLILSDNAPSFPFIQLRLEPTDWLRINYIHGWLNSLVFDSTRFIYTHTESIDPDLRQTYFPKFIAANMITISPFHWLDFSLGNSYVYGGELRPEVFIPFMYYKATDHNFGRGSQGDGNGALFFDASIKYFKNTQLYYTFYIDVLNLRDLLDGNTDKQWLGYTFGAKGVDFILNNLLWKIEYTRTNPWLYENRDEISDYKHLGFVLGHWIGQNADQLRIQFDYPVKPNLSVSLFTEIFRKGGMDDIAYAYSKRVDGRNPFLYSPLRKDFKFGVSSMYEFYYNCYAKLNYYYSSITDEASARTPKFQLGNKHNLNFSLQYGL